MSLSSEESMVQPDRWHRFVAHLPAAFSIVVGILTVLGFVVGLVLAGSRQPEVAFWGGVIVSAAMLLVAGVGLSGLLLLAGTVLQQVSQLSDRTSSLDQRTAILAEQAVAQSQREAAGAQRRVDPELRTLLLELRETLLLPEPERQRRFERLVERELQRGLVSAEQMIISRDFHRARDVLVALRERFGTSDPLREAEERLERAAEITRAGDIAEISRRVEEQMAFTRWDEAEAIARELADKYPIAPEPAGLLIRVQRERKLFEQRNRQRLHDEIQQLVRERRWQQAAEAARKFVENFPTGADSDALRGQMETLQANADIQLRQQLEQQLKEFVRRQQYWEALALARRMLTEYPLSPQANALRGQVPRLEELARRQPPPT